MFLLRQILGKASQLINISKSRIAFHVQQKRYDAIAGVYNLLLDEEITHASKLHDGRTTAKQDNQNNSVIRVCIKSVTTDGTETGNQNEAQDSESESASSCEGSNSQPEAEQDWGQVSARKHKVHKPTWVVQLGIVIPYNGTASFFSVNYYFRFCTCAPGCWQKSWWLNESLAMVRGCSFRDSQSLASKFYVYLGS